ncbi:MAG: hypothetical protein NZ919_00755 [Candidatus Caldarchaeum sp.]|nr:hypothetical protein [Candidatus Caldarchaeum sp.]
MNVHFAVCGIGLGHASRSVVLARALLRRGHKITFSAYSQAYDYLRKAGFKASRVPSVNYGVGPDGVVSFKQTILSNITLPVRFLAQTGAETVNLSESKADCVVSDTRASAVAAAHMLGKPVATILNQYNLVLQARKHRRLAKILEQAVQAPRLVWDMSDLLIIPDLPPPYTISEATLQIPEKTRSKAVYVGPLTEQRHFTQSHLETLRVAYGARDKPLIIVNISGGRMEKKTLIKKLLDMAPKLSDKHVYVLSMAEPESNDFFKVGPMVVHGWVEDMDSLMMASDLVIGRSGLTLISKCIAFGKKMLLIPTPLHGEQSLNAEKARKIGLAEVVEQEELTPYLFEEKVAEVLGNAVMDSAVGSLRNLASNLGGAGRAAAAVEQLVLNLS